MRRGSTLVLAITIALLACASCLAPPALIAADGVDLARRIAEMPAGTERVEIAVADGSCLRGVYVAGDPGAPLCVHLLGSSDTVASQRHPQRTLLSHLRDLGVASLMLDYRGVGASSGARHVDHLAEDALAMWREALRRVGGDEQRVVLRATSIGTVATAQLLETGARPAGIVLIAPILPETVVRRYASVEHGWYGPWLAQALFRPVARVDVLRELEHAARPLLVRSSPADRFLSDAERAEFRAAVLRAPEGHWESVTGGHYFSALQGRGLTVGEIEFWRTTIGTPVESAARSASWKARLPQGAWERIEATPGAVARFEQLAERKRDGDPDLYAAAAIELPDADLAARLLWALEVAPYPPPLRARMQFADWCDALSLADPAGPLPAAWWVEKLELRAATARGLKSWFLYSPGLIGDEVSEWRPGRSLWVTETYTAGGESGAVHFDMDQIGGALLERLPNCAARRQLARLYMRVMKVPERVRTDANGGTILETWNGQTWDPVDTSRFGCGPVVPMMSR
jgi:hypothetical protein